MNWNRTTPARLSRGGFWVKRVRGERIAASDFVLLAMTTSVLGKYDSLSAFQSEGFTRHRVNKRQPHGAELLMEQTQLVG